MFSSTKATSWLEISRSAFKHNIELFKQIIGPKVSLLLPVKANAYGHGLLEISKLAVKSGVNWLGVNSLTEAEELAKLRLKTPVLILGYVPIEQLKRLKKFVNVRLCAYNLETIKKLGQLNFPVKIHVKLETGTYRQGVEPNRLISFIKQINQFKNIQIEGLYTHFANIEDTLDHSYAFGQLKIFNRAVKFLSQRWMMVPPILHVACSAAAILHPATHLNLVRAGISLYGLWSSRETRLIVQKQHQNLSLRPVLSWKTIIAQIKKVKKGESIGYGRAEFVSRNTKIAIIPAGYFEGLDRRLSTIGHCLVKGKRAKILGRICMNMSIIDITDISGVKLEDEVVIIGRQGQEEITADEIAQKIGTINYEVVSRINPNLKRIIVK